MVIDAKMATFAWESSRWLCRRMRSAGEDGQVSTGKLGADCRRRGATRSVESPFPRGSVGTREVLTPKRGRIYQRWATPRESETHRQPKALTGRHKVRNYLTSVGMRRQGATPLGSTTDCALCGFP